MVSDPAGPVAAVFMELGATVVREVAKLSARQRYGVTWDEQQRLLRVALPPAGGADMAPAPFYLEPALVRRNDTSARSINEWTGEAEGGGAEVSPDIKPLGVAAMGNYAAQIQWEDGFSQVCSGCRWVVWRAELVEGVSCVRGSGISIVNTLCEAPPAKPHAVNASQPSFAASLHAGRAIRAAALATRPGGAAGCAGGGGRAGGSSGGAVRRTRVR